MQVTYGKLGHECIYRHSFEAVSKIRWKKFCSFDVYEMSISKYKPQQQFSIDRMMRTIRSF